MLYCLPFPFVGGEDDPSVVPPGGADPPLQAIFARVSRSPTNAVNRWGAEGSSFIVVVVAVVAVVLVFLLRACFLLFLPRSRRDRCKGCSRDEVVSVLLYRAGNGAGRGNKDHSLYFLPLGCVA